MNQHEAERIAAAIHQLRPDWPTKQLLTLLGNPALVDRPRRDVVVALSWIACESGTANPYRVLEAGPWWRAVAVEGGSTYRQPNRGPWCGICGIGRDLHRAADHDFEPPANRKRSPDAMDAITEDLRQRVALTSPPPEPDDAPTPHDPRADAARAALTPARTRADEETKA